jgi:hypothetical protein
MYLNNLMCTNRSNSQKLGTPPMRWTPHMEESLRHLSSEPQCDNDEILVIITKCSRILDDIFAASSCALSDGDCASPPEPESFPLTFPIKVLRGMLEEVQEQIRPRLLESSGFSSMNFKVIDELAD